MPLTFELVLNVRQMVLTGVNSVELNRQEAVMLKALSESVNGNLPYYRLLELCGDEVVSEIAKATLEVRIVRLRKSWLKWASKANPYERFGVRAINCCSVLKSFSWAGGL